MGKEATSASASKQIDARIKDLGDWRGKTLSRVRQLIKQADPDIVEEVKWRKPSNPLGVPVWSQGGMICTGETYKDKVKFTFAKGAAIKDPAGLFNASLEGKTRRAIDIHEGDKLNEKAFKALVGAAVSLNGATAKPKAAKKPTASKNKTTPKPKLLSGGNPQIPKGDGDAPVQAYIDAMPGWKGDVGRRLDALVDEAVPRVRKAVRWNSPFYGIEGKGWFLSYHCFTKYIKLTFLRGASLKPQPPIESKHADVRYYHIHEDDELDERILTKWIKQAAKVPGDPLF